MGESLNTYLDKVKDLPSAKPYLNACEYTPNEGEKRTEKDDKTSIFDAISRPLDYDINERIRMPIRQFDRIFEETMTYFREVEHLQYEAVQKGELSIEGLNSFILQYIDRIHPEVKHEVDRRKLIERLDTAIAGYYVLQPLIDNPETSDIKVCGPKDIRVRVKGDAYSSNAGFINEADLTNFVVGICLRNNVGFGQSPVITFADQHERDYILRFVISHPRINMVNYPYLHIRKVPRTKPDFDELIRRGMLNENLKNYLIYKAKYSRAIVFAGPPGCVDRETEFFDGKQWKSLADYKEGDQVLQYDTKTGEASLTMPLAYIKKKCDKMYHFETRHGINQTLSPEHRVLYRNKTHLNGKRVWSDRFKEISAEELKDKQNAGAFNGGFDTVFSYSGEGFPLSDVEIELMLAVICDGSFNKQREHSNRCTINIKKQRKIEAMDDIMQRWGGKYKRTECANGYVRYMFAAPRKEKVFTPDWYSCTKDQLQLICDNILKWDGAIDKKGRRAFFSTEKQSADFVQFAFSACGFRATMGLDRRAGQPYKIGGKEYIRKSNCYTVCISSNTIVGMAYHNNRKNNVRLEEVKPSDGYKYCFTVPTHALVLRRDGKIFITGNSGKTTALNAFIEYIPKVRETLVIQENDELFTRQPGFMFKHVTHGYDGYPAYSLEDLGKMALVEGCQEFIVGEVKGGEMRNVMTLLNAGGWTALTVHSTNAYETLDKLADLVKYGSSYSFTEARRMLKTFDTVVYMEGYKIREVLEVRGYNEDTNSFNYVCVYKYDDTQAQREHEEWMEKHRDEESVEITNPAESF